MKQKFGLFCFIVSALTVYIPGTLFLNLLDWLTGHEPNELLRDIVLGVSVFVA